jgi:hypothetical protein
MSNLLLTQVRRLQPGDLVDLEGDPYAATQTEVWRTSDEYLYAEVIGIEQETPECIRVDFESHPSIGFPTDHVVMVSTD